MHKRALQKMKIHWWRQKQWQKNKKILKGWQMTEWLGVPRYHPKPFFSPVPRKDMGFRVDVLRNSLLNTMTDDDRGRNWWGSQLHKKQYLIKYLLWWLFEVCWLWLWSIPERKFDLQIEEMKCSCRGGEFGKRTCSNSKTSSQGR